MTISHDSSATANLTGTLDSASPTSLDKQPTRLQFSLSTLLILTALVAVGMVLLKNFGHWGLVCITAASFIFTIYALDLRNFARRRMIAKADRPAIERVVDPTNASMLRMLVDMIWGIGLPLLCFAYDPGLLQDSSPQASFGEMAVATALWQMLLLLAWLMLGPRGPAWNGVMAGGMLVGSILAGLIAIPFTLLAMMFSLALGLGLPGFVPLMTTWVFTRNWSLASFTKPTSDPDHKRYQLAFFASLLFALFFPTLLVWLSNVFEVPFHFPQLPQKVVNQYDSIFL